MSPLTLYIYGTCMTGLRESYISYMHAVFKANLFSNGEETDSSFPEVEDLVNSTVDSDNDTGIGARIKIPESLIRAVTSQGGDLNFDISFIIMAYSMIISLSFTRRCSGSEHSDEQHSRFSAC